MFQVIRGACPCEDVVLRRPEHLRLAHSRPEAGGCHSQASRAQQYELVLVDLLLNLAEFWVEGSFPRRCCCVAVVAGVTK